MGVLCRGWEGRDVERAHVHGVYTLAIRRWAMMGLAVGHMLIMGAAVMRK